MTAEEQFQFFAEKTPNKCFNSNRAKIYEKQILTSQKIAQEYFYKTTRYGVLCAQMQSGKTGCIGNLAYLIANNPDLNAEMKIDNEGKNIFLITTLNFNDVSEQIKRYFISFSDIPNIEYNVLKLSDLSRILKTYKKDITYSDSKIIKSIRKNALIILDESHLVSDTEQTVEKFYKEIIGIKMSFEKDDKRYADTNNLYFLSVSATPMAETLSKGYQGVQKMYFTLDVDKNEYWGAVEMLNNNKVFDSFSLSSLTGRRELFKIIDNAPNFSYILVRVSGQSNETLKKFLSRKGIKVSEYTQKQLESINLLILNQPPEEKEVILLKQKLRASIQINTEHISVVFDNFSKQSDVTVQSLLGRCCGYDKNKSIIIYTNKKAVVTYANWVNNDFDIRYVGADNRNTKKCDLDNNKLNVLVLAPAVLRFHLTEKQLKFVKSARSSKDKREILSWFADEIKEFDVFEPNDYLLGTLHKSGSWNAKSSQDTYDRKKGKMVQGDHQERWNDKPELVGKYVITMTLKEKEKDLEVSMGCIHRNDKYITEYFGQLKAEVSSRSVYNVRSPKIVSINNKIRSIK